MRRGLSLLLTPVMTTVTTVLLGATPATAQAAPEPDCPWVGSDAPVEEKVGQVLSRLTLDEKLGLVHGAAGPFEFVGPTYAGLVPAVPRLCIPQLGLSDGPAGVGNGHTGVTQLPAPLALAASWDRELARKYGGVIAREVQGKGANVVLGPTVDLLRDPRAGRAFETLGEDPHLVGELAAAQVGGIQDEGALAQAKHLAAYNQETLRNTPADNAVVDERTLQEIYLSPVQDTVDAGVASVMCGYNRLNGVHSCNNSYLLNQVLKGQFGFDGFVTSDWFATQASHAAANAGLDLQMPGGCLFGPRLRAGVAKGAVSTARLDDMVARILRPMFRHGLFDRPATGSPDDVVTTPQNAAVARRVAEAGMVLLKNDDAVLPVENRRSIAVLGEAAGAGVIGSGGGSPHVIAPSIVTPFEGIADRAAQDGIEVRFDAGRNAERLAADADLAVVVVSKWSTESKDNKGIALSARDNRLVEKVAAANPNTIVVLNTGGPVAMPWLDDVAGVVAAWYPGQEYGDALASVLFGDTEPSGRLPVTFPAALADMPTSDPARFPGGRYDEGLAVGYRWYDREGIEPLFPFGYGLSYTTFGYSDLRVEGDGGDSGDVVTVNVTNTGSRAGTEVAQLYVGRPGTAGEPPKRLEGFQRVELRPGETRQVRFELDERSLAHWDTGSHRWVRGAGDHTIAVGGSSRELPVSTTVHVPETVAVSEATPPPPPGAPTGGDDFLTTVGNVLTCPTEMLYAGAVGAISLVGLPPGKQAEIEPANPSAGG